MTQKLTNLLGLTLAGIGVLASGAVAQDPDLYDELEFRTMEIVFTNPNWDQQLRDNWVIDQNTGENVYVSADLIIDGVTFSNVGVQYKGNSSYSAVTGLKKPYKITTDAFVPDQEVWGFDKVTLNNGAFDASKAREVVALKIMREFMPASRANLVHVFSGTPGSMNDLGVYTSVERVNKRFTKKHFNNGDGHRYKAQFASLTYEGTDPAQYDGPYTIKGGDPATEWQDLISLVDTLNNTPIPMLREALDSEFVIDQLCWQVAAGVGLLNTDGIRFFPGFSHNYFIYQDTYNGRMKLMPWDLDLAWSDAPNVPINDGFFEPGIPVVYRGITLLPEIYDRYLAHLREIRGRIDWGVIEQDVIRYRGWTDSVVSTIHEQELFSHADYVQSHADLQGLVVLRRQFLDQTFLLNRPLATITGVSHAPAVPLGTEPVVVTASVSITGAGLANDGVVLFSRDRGKYNRAIMRDDGLSGDGLAGDGVYGATIPAYAPGEVVEYYIEASNDDTIGGGTGAKKYAPIYAEHAPFTYTVRSEMYDSPLVINEFMADNDTVIADEAGQFEDWIEIYNTGVDAIDLEGYFLSDDLTDSTKWAFPSVVIPGGGFVLVWADKDPLDGPLHASIKLSSGGEDVALFAPLALGNGLIDGRTFGPQTVDVSAGRMCDGDETWVAFTVSTPNATNGPCDCQADLSGDGVVDSGDLQLFINLFLGGDPGADLTGDGVVDSGDLQLFISLFLAGC